MTTELTIAFRPNGDLGDQVHFRAEAKGKIWAATGLTTGRYLTAAEQASLFALLQTRADSVSLKELIVRYSISKTGVSRLVDIGALCPLAPSTAFTQHSVKAYEGARQAVLALLDLETKFDLSNELHFDRLAEYIDQAMSDIKLCSAKAYDATVRFAKLIVPSARAEAPVTATTNLAEAVCSLVEMFQLCHVLSESQLATLGEYEDWVMYD